jgi:hypothetical protein
MAKGKTSLLHTFKVTMSDDMSAPLGYQANERALLDGAPDNVVAVKYINTVARKVKDDDTGD